MTEGITLFVTETECAERLGFSARTWAGLSGRYERLGMPRKDPVSRRRYWPAIREFFDRHNAVVTGAPAGDSEQGVENREALTKGRRGNRA